MARIYCWKYSERKIIMYAIIYKILIRFLIGLWFDAGIRTPHFFYCSETPEKSATEGASILIVKNSNLVFIKINDFSIRNQIKTQFHFFF
jgi:hypothetical protein